MKIAPLFLLFAAVSAGPPAHAGGGGGDDECTNSHGCDCFTCDDVKNTGDGFLEVTIGHCKDGSISWMCCSALDGVVGGCPTPKQETVGSAGYTIRIPDDSLTFEINTHDGKTAGDALNVQSVCGGPAGGQGGSCAIGDVTAHCLVEYDLELDCGYTPPAATTVAPPVTTVAPPATTVAPPVVAATTTTVAPPVLPTTDDPMTTTSKPGTQGDPHFKTHSGEMYDFHGGCDLVLVENPDFMNGLGLTVHIRTKIETWWSYVESAVLKIGEETMEIHQDQFYINGQLTPVGEPVITRFNGLVFKYEKVGDNTEAHILIGNGEKILMKTYKGFVKVQVAKEGSEQYKGSHGLLGRFPDGKRVARDGETFLEDVNAFGQEWQVQVGEPKLFQSYDDAWVVPAGQKCAMPDSSAAKLQLRQRRLASGLDTASAEKACAHLEDAKDRQACVYDVIATQDMDMAGAW